MSDSHLELHIAQDSGAVPLPTRGTTVAFRNENAEGSAYWINRKAGSGTSSANEARLIKLGANCRFETQVQFLFKYEPRGPLLLQAELRDEPMRINLVTRALCRVLLGLIKQQANRRGIEFRYSFGDAKSLPSITVPLLGVDRIVFSDSLLQLPLETPDDRGTWKMQGGKLVPVERSSVQIVAGTCMTVMFATNYLDFEEWAVTNIPGVGQLDLRQFWGSQAMHAVFFDEGSGAATSATSKDTRRVFYELKCASVNGQAEVMQSPKGSESDEEEVKDSAMEFINAAPEEAEVTTEGPVSGTTECAISDNLTDDDSQGGTHYTEEDEDSQDGQEGPDSSDSAEDEPKPGEDGEWEMQSSISLQSKNVLATLNAQRQFVTRDLEGSVSPRSVSPKSPLAPWSPDQKAGSVLIPWYFCNGAGDLWWCIAYNGCITWRHHSQLTELCVALGGHLPELGTKSSIRNLEFGRRVATRLLTQGASAPGLLEEFTEMDVSLGSLLCGEIRPQRKAIFAGVIEAEGRIVERYIRAKGQTLRWFVGRSRHRHLKLEESIDLKLVSFSTKTAAGVSGLKLETPHKTYILLAKDQHHHSMMKQTLQNLTTDGVFGTIPSIPKGIEADPTSEEADKTVSSMLALIKSYISAAVAEAAARSPSAAWVVGKVNEAHDKALEAATKLRRPAPPWQDLLLRWPSNRIVINNVEVCLGVPPADPLAFSAELLRSAVAAQDSPEMVRAVSTLSCGLKCVNLESLSQQDLWSFWMNIYHSLCVHAQLVAGRPGSIQQIVGFYNSCSYLVAGHVFSLVEIEHRILRQHMTKPRVFLAIGILKIWPRTDQDLVTRPCLAAPVCAARCFECRPDWRLNLVLNAGNQGCSDSVPVFESTDKASFDEIMQLAMKRTLASSGSVKKGSVELPYGLWRYRDDAPAGNAQDPPERRWVKELLPDIADSIEKIGYKRSYGWTMRYRVELLSWNDSKLVSL